MGVYLGHGLRDIGAVQPGGSEDAPAVMRCHLDHILVGDVVAEVPVAPGGKAEGDPRFVHFPEHEFFGNLMDGRGRRKAEFRAEGLVRGRGILLSETFERGTEPHVDNHDIISFAEG